jgi:hypothetical protein
MTRRKPIARIWLHRGLACCGGRKGSAGMRLQLRLGRAHKGQSDDGLDAGHGESWRRERRESRELIAAQTSQAGRTSGGVYGGFGVRV